MYNFIVKNTYLYYLVALYPGVWGGGGGERKRTSGAHCLRMRLSCHFVMMTSTCGLGFAHDVDIQQVQKVAHAQPQIVLELSAQATDSLLHIFVTVICLFVSVRCRLSSSINVTSLYG